MKLESQKFVGKLDVSNLNGIVKIDGINLSPLIDSELFHEREVVVTIRQVFPGEIDIIRELIEAEKRETIYL